MAEQKFDPNAIQPGDIVILKGGEELCVLAEKREIKDGVGYYKGFNVTLKQPRFDSTGIIKHTPQSELSPQQARFWTEKAEELALRQINPTENSSFGPNKIIIILIVIALIIAIATWL